MGWGEGGAVKVYLGDAVYCALECSTDLVLTTEDGIRETNRIVLEPEVLTQFLLLVKRITGKETL